MAVEFPKIPKYYEGDLRYIRKYLWTPRTLLNPDTGIHETRWLCFAILIEERWEFHYGPSFDLDRLEWREIAFAGKVITPR